MWDVKVTLAKLIQGDSEGFTLTMWDVKENFEIVVEDAEESFTLTMWDVKSANQAATALRAAVLP